MKSAVRSRVQSRSEGAAAHRIACVQGGDYWTTRQRLEMGDSEFYSGQRYSIDAFEKFVDGRPHLVVSLDAPSYVHDRGLGRFRGVPAMRTMRPRRVAEWWRARKIISELERFGATHLIVRCNDLIGCELLSWAASHHVPTAGILASRFATEHRLSRPFCELGNGDHVAFLANHNRAATASMIECGLSASKAVAWDYPPAVTPHDWPSKKLAMGEHAEILFVGRVCKEKGVYELIEACGLLHEQGVPLKLTIGGDGPALPEIRNHPGVQRGWIECKGLLPNVEAHKLMRSSAITVVPSRHDFAEGLPLVVYESLAMRTPLILNDHPIFMRYFRDDCGVRFFADSDPVALADQIRRLLNDGDAYARLSEETGAVWQSIQCPTTFHDVLHRLSDLWKLSPANEKRSAVHSTPVTPFEATKSQKDAVRV